MSSSWKSSSSRSPATPSTWWKYSSPHQVQKTLQSESRPWIWLFTALLPLRGSPPRSHYHPQIAQPHGLFVVIQCVAGGFGDFASALHDKQAPRHREHHGSLCVVPGIIQGLLHIPLVRKELVRIFRWEFVVWTSFIAGIVQTLLYADFMYYFFKANQNDKFVVFPVWYGPCILTHIHPYFIHLFTSPCGPPTWNADPPTPITTPGAFPPTVLPSEATTTCLCIPNTCGTWCRTCSCFPMTSTLSSKIKRETCLTTSVRSSGKSRRLLSRWIT